VTLSAAAGDREGRALRSRSLARSWLSLYARAILAPKRTFDALMSEPRRLRFGALALGSCALLYTLVYVFLILGRGRPTVFEPWLPIDPEVYYRWNVFFVGPSMALSWVVGGAVAQGLARLFGGRGTFTDTLSALGFGVAIASWWTLLHDLATAFLGAIHVMNQRWYEDALSGDTPFHTFYSVIALGYAVSFVFYFGKGIASAQRLRLRAALPLGFVAFAAYQLTFVVFNR
jgi:hypothetical protein